ncbi:hypothetical protein [Pseudomonas phage Njord]|uniref:Uncharacterized protein n=1 Tax=Pseudomonas phage Njord TaxID=2163985 RepID=A0A2S1GML0_9CAUD|nr:acetyl-CoA acetyltransferase [Pseudomonas phage Njord]AWD90628.1 hypothetical protein [Pseudomonas phage Njord]
MALVVSVAFSLLLLLGKEDNLIDREVYPMATPITGDQKDHVEVKKEGVTLHNMPIVSSAHLLDKGAQINISQQSGKRVGALVTAVVSGSPVLYQAKGPLPTDVWVAVTKAATDVTPV